MEVQSIGPAIIALEKATLAASLADMQKPAVDPMQPLPTRSHPVVSITGDVNTAFVADTVTPAGIAHIAALLEPQQSADIARRISGLSTDTVSAVQLGDYARAISNVSEIAVLDARALEPLRTDNLLEAIRPQVDLLVNRLTTVAKMNAEGLLAQADEILASPVPASLPNPPVTKGPTAQTVSPVPNFLPAVTLATHESVTSIAAQQSPETGARITELAQDTASALRDGDRSRAFANVTEIVALDPQAVRLLQTDKLFTSMRPELDHLLTRLAAARVTSSTAATVPAASASAAPVKPEILLQVAHRLFDAGGYVNYVRSADLAQSVMNPLTYSPILEQYAAAAAGPQQPRLLRLKEDELFPKPAKLVIVGNILTALRGSATPRLQTLWRRAPLLILLLTWLAAGLIGGSASLMIRALWPDSWPASLMDFGFNLWATGFLALVCFGFYARTRDIRT